MPCKVAPQTTRPARGENGAKAAKGKWKLVRIELRRKWREGAASLARTAESAHARDAAQTGQVEQ
eukprot:2131803-Pleurochrysis_carterae.AAC.1